MHTGQRIEYRLLKLRFNQQKKKTYNNCQSQNKLCDFWPLQCKNMKTIMERGIKQVKHSHILDEKCLVSHFE